MRLGERRRPFRLAEAEKNDPHLVEKGALPNPSFDNDPRDTSTPEAMGDYLAGPNHVLPTSRTARFSSGLSVLDFVKRTTLLSLDARSIAALGPDAIALAEAEGLDAHARSIAARLNR